MLKCGDCLAALIIYIFLHLIIYSLIANIFFSIIRKYTQIIIKTAPEDYLEVIAQKFHSKKQAKNGLQLQSLQNGR